LNDTLVVINHTRNSQMEYLDLGFMPDTAIIDPYLKLISANNKVTRINDNGSGSNSVSIFPNPVGDQFSILLRNFSSPNISITIHNSIGQLIWKQEKNLVNASDYISMQSGNWSKGIYWLSIRSKDFNYVKKIMK
jgi:Secretion system C-terminal sorting domain